jgi:hypothetical protein
MTYEKIRGLGEVFLSIYKKGARFAHIYKEPLRGTLNRPPQPSLREGIPALLRRGMGNTTRREWLLIDIRAKRAPCYRLRSTLSRSIRKLSSRCISRRVSGSIAALIN